MINKETQELIDKIQADMKKDMSEERYTHCVNVMNKCIELAKIHNVDENEAALAGMTHDIAKEIPDEEAIKLIQENGWEYDGTEKEMHFLYHQKAGAIIAKNRYGLNENIQKAIMYHASTTPDMNDLGKIVFIADKIAEGREGKMPLIKEYREAAERNLDEAVLILLDNNIKHLIDKKKKIHPNAILTRNKLLGDTQNN